MSPPISPPSPFTPPGNSSTLDRWVPACALLRNYSPAWLANDLFAGLVLTAMLVPAGMAYAQAAGLPAICGLYATIVPLLVYAVFGPSRVLVLGPDSSLAPLIAAAILPLAAGNAERALSLAGMLAILSGALCLIAGLTKFGFVTELLSKPIRYGYMNGIALTMLIGQLPTVLGLSVSGDNFLQRGIASLAGAWQGQINWTAATISLACLAVIFGCRFWAPKVPGVLLAVAGATFITWQFDLAAQHSISVVGPLPRGLPTLHLPIVTLAEFQALLSVAVALAFVSFADMSVLSRSYAHRGGYEVDANQELVALGLANMVTGVFQGFAVSSSSSRTPVAESAGAKSQVAGVVGAICIALLLIFAPKLLKNLPHAALGAVVISACVGLFEFAGVIRLYRLRRSELVYSLACFLGVTLFGVVQGIFIAIGLALLAFIWRAWRPYDAVLGRVDGLKGYHDISRHPEAKRIPGLVLFRWDAPLFFANAAVFQEHVLQAVAAAPTLTKWVVVAAEPVTDIDITAADMLAELDQRLHTAGMELCFAEMKGPVKDRLKCYGLFTTLGTENFFPTIGQAVDRYLATHQVEWRDWEDQVHPSV